MIKEITADTFICSDHHFGHKSICEWEPDREIKAKQYGFDNWEEMLIDQHNEVVSEEDTVLFLGDFAFNNIPYWLERLNGKKMIVLGNHDRKGSQVYRDMYHVFSGIYIKFNEKEFIHQDDDKLLSAVITEINGNKIMLCHYALFHEDDYNRQPVIPERIRILEGFYDIFGCEHIVHGHLHSKTSDHKHSTCVCVEHTDYKPVRLGDLIK